MNSAEVYDLRIRRGARPVDARQIIDNLIEGADALRADVSSWPGRFLRESNIIGAERSLVALQNLLIDLRAFVPATGET
jgi:hypothetical protein